MYYKIVGINDNCPDRPSVYRGQFDPVFEEPPVLTALAAEFGDGNKGQGAAANLMAWSGGESEYWHRDIAQEAHLCIMDPKALVEYPFYLDDTTFHVYVQDEPFEENSVQSDINVGVKRLVEKAETQEKLTDELLNACEPFLIWLTTGMCYPTWPHQHDFIQAHRNLREFRKQK